MKITFLPTNSPSNVAVCAARTCYSSKGIIKDSTDWSKSDELLLSLYKSGHHTTLQHTHITMQIEGISRYLIWRLLHSHSFYNSEQVSQRYAKADLSNVYIPSDKNLNTFYQDRFNDYNKLTELFTPHFQETLPKHLKKDASKKAQEIARYVLPIGVTADLYHTVNILTILRYIAAAPHLPEATEEALEFANLLEIKLLQIDPKLKSLIKLAKKSKVVFPKIEYVSQKITNVVNKVEVFDIYKPLEFDINENYADVLRMSQMFFDGGILGGFNTYMELSLSADAQNQRHRRSQAIRPKLDINSGFYTPEIIKNNEEALSIYKNAIQKSYEMQNVYAFLNANKIKIIEHNDLSSFHHKAQIRLCLNAQDEIRDITNEQVRQLDMKHIYKAPCQIRVELGIKPYCPEGSRFCGVSMWKK